MEIQDRLKAFRQLMTQHGFAAYIIPPTDPHQSEYIADHWKVREWFSGFTGSAGTIVVTQDFAGLWTDSRYFLQAGQQLDGTGIELVKLVIPHTPEYIDWLCDHLEEDSIVGVDGKVFSESLTAMMEKRFSAHGIDLNSEFDLPGMLWEERPPVSTQQVYEHELKYAGTSRTQKIEQVQSEMKKQAVDYHLLTALDDIAWLFNLRGSDVEFNPVFIAYAIVSSQEALLFIHEQKLPGQLAQILKDDGVVIKAYEELDEYLKQLPRDSTILYASSKTSHYIAHCISTYAVKKDDMSIPTLLKACKTEAELKHIDNAMVKDGQALVKFFKWLEENLEKTHLTEYTLDEKLTSFRALQPGYKGNSFATIAGYKDHGAIIHYSAAEHSAYPLQPEGMLLLDSGAQYLDGTTDITRTICLGKPSDAQIRDYTLVLKGLIKLSLAQFPEGTKGFHLDALARFPLWSEGKNYGHGTGHGVGFFLNVHEGPQGITPNPAVNFPLMPGMIQSNEPGFYPQGEYGVRLENIIVVKVKEETEYGRFLCFETLTLYPFEHQLIDSQMLNPQEKDWLNRYHQKVFEKLSPGLSREENQWLLEKTRPLK